MATRSFRKTLSTLPCFILYSKAKLACYSRYLLTSYYSFQSPMTTRTSIFWCTHTHTHTHLRHVERETPEQDKPNLFAARSAGVTPQGTVCARWRLREALESSPGVLPRTPTCSRHSSITRSFPGDFVSDSPSIAFYPVAVVQPLSHV